MQAATIPRHLKIFGLPMLITLSGTLGLVPQAAAIECGDLLIGGIHKLTQNLTCDGSGAPAITVADGAHLNLNGNVVACNDSDREGIVVLGSGVTVRNGTVTGCRNGVVITEAASRNLLSRIEALASDRNGVSVEGANNRVIHSLAENNGRDGMNVSGSSNRLLANESNYNGRRGFNIDESDGNRITSCLAGNNGRQGVIINEGNNNRVVNCTVYRSCRDGIEIDGEGRRNRIVNNLVVNNGNAQTCEDAGEDYRPWFYAGIDLTEGAADNTVVSNKTSQNRGCGTSDFTTCDTVGVRDRNLWDENPDDSDPPNCNSNRWRANRVDGRRAEPECGQTSSD